MGIAMWTAMGIGWGWGGDMGIWGCVDGLHRPATGLCCTWDGVGVMVWLWHVYIALSVSEVELWTLRRAERAPTLIARIVALPRMGLEPV